MGFAPSCLDDLLHGGWPTTELHAAPFYIGTGNIEFVPGNSFRLLEPTNNRQIVVQTVAKDVHDYLCVVFSQQRQLVSKESLDSDVLQANRVEHSRRGLANAGRGRPLHRLSRDALGDDPTQSVQIEQMGKLYPISKRPTRGNDGIAQAQSANLYAKVNAVGSTHTDTSKIP
jgi:hypothetical protein